MPRKHFNDRSTQISTNSLLKAFPFPLSHLPKKGYNSMKLDEQRNHFRKTQLHRRCLNCNKIKKRRKKHSQSTAKYLRKAPQNARSINSTDTRRHASDGNQKQSSKTAAAPVCNLSSTLHSCSCLRRICANPRGLVDFPFYTCFPHYRTPFGTPFLPRFLPLACLHCEMRLAKGFSMGFSRDSS